MKLPSLTMVLLVRKWGQNAEGRVAYLPAWRQHKHCTKYNQTHLQEGKREKQRLKLWNLRA